MIKIAKTISWIAAIVVASSLAIIAPAFAQTSVGANVGATVNVQGGVRDGANGGARFGGMPGGGIFGTVSAINGTTLTVTGNSHPMRPMGSATGTAPSSAAAPAPTVYTVDASNATVYKGSATTTASVASIAVGDTVMVQGTVSGTNVAATVIRDGMFRMPSAGGRNFMGHGASSTPSGTPIVQGNGEPVVGGSVTAVSGTTLTITNASNVTYTIDAANATVVVKGATSTVANIATGDNLIVQGAVNGNAVTASSIIDQGQKPAASSGNASSTHPGAGMGAGIGGFFGAIGGFFKHLFGF